MLVKSFPNWRALEIERFVIEIALRSVEDDTLAYTETVEASNSFYSSKMGG